MCLSRTVIGLAPCGSREVAEALKVWCRRVLDKVLVLARKEAGGLVRGVCVLGFSGGVCEASLPPSTASIATLGPGQLIWHSPLSEPSTRSCPGVSRSLPGIFPRAAHVSAGRADGPGHLQPPAQPGCHVLQNAAPFVTQACMVSLPLSTCPSGSFDSVGTKGSSEPS